jgi:hypothetical protein
LYAGKFSVFKYQELHKNVGVMLNHIQNKGARSWKLDAGGAALFEKE